MWLMTFSPSLPIALRRFIVWGVPSFAILGFVGIASKWWLTMKPASTPSTPANVTDSSSSPSCDATEQHVSSSPSCDATEKHATSDDDSGLVDHVRSSGSKQEQPNQLPTSSVDFDPTWVQSLTPCIHTMRTSSNVRLPCVHTMRTSSDVTLPSCDDTQNGNPLDNDDSIKPKLSAACGLKHPTMHSEEIQFEVSVMETDVSGEGNISLSGTSHNCSEGLLSSACTPVSGEVTMDSTVQSKPCSNPDCSSLNKNESACCQNLSELKESALELSSVTMPKHALISRKDRTRIQLQLPRDIIGRFIGKQGRNIKALMLESDGAHIYINQKNLPKESQFVPCTIQGSAKQVEEALAIIESKFPEIIIPGTMINGISMQQFQQTVPVPGPLFNTSSGCLESWDFELPPASIPPNPFLALVSYIESLKYVWLVACEKSLELDNLHQTMSYIYCCTATGNGLLLAKENSSNLLNKFCAVKVSEIHWLRGKVMRLGDDPSSYEVQLVDYGSCVVVPPPAIKPLRKEHCKLPVQAFKSQLANVKPNNGDQEIVSRGLVNMQKLVEAMVLEVHVTDKIFVPSCGLEGKVDSISTSSTSLPSPSATLAAEPEVNNIHPAVSIMPVKSREGKECLEIQGDLSRSTNMSIDALSSSGESGVKKADSTGTSMSIDALSSSGVCDSSLDASGESLSSPKYNQSADRKCLFSLSKENDHDRDVLQNPPVENGKVKSSSGDLSDVKEEEHPVSRVDEAEALLHGFSQLAPYVPVVELYTQLGAQTPIFINRELVELGHAVWIEDKNCL